MISRILLAVPQRAMAFLFLLAVLLLSAPGTQAKNRYEVHNEGDPGDGVLQPRPHVIPPNLGPQITSTSPFGIFRLILFNTWSLPNHLLTFLNSILFFHGPSYLISKPLALHKEV